MLEGYINILFDLWRKAEFQELGIMEIFGLIGVAVSSAALAFYLKLESVKDSKAFKISAEEDETDDTPDTRRVLPQNKQPGSPPEAETSSTELINLLSEIVLKSNLQSPLDNDDGLSAIDDHHASACEVLLRTPQKKQKGVKKSESSSKKMQSVEKEANSSPNLQNFLERMISSVPNSPIRHFNEDELKKIIFHIHQTAMMSYEEQYAERCTTLLLMCPAAINAPRHPHGFTPFLSACWAGSVSLVRFMLQNGADLSDRTVDGDTPMYLAVRGTLDTYQANPSLALLRTLHDAGCDVNCRNRSGFTPLHLAATCGNARVTKWLLEHGASTTRLTLNGHRAVELARIEGHEHLVPLLEAAETQRQKKVKLRSTSIYRAATPNKSTSSSTCSSVNSAEDSCCSDHEP